SYLGSSPRLLFILKEVNGGGDWDLREFVKNGGRAQTWDNISRWVEGIRSLPHETRWSGVERMDESRRRSLLNSVAAMNIKKSPGGGSAELVAPMKAASEDVDLISEQFKIYDADLVICCGSPVRAL